MNIDPFTKEDQQWFAQCTGDFNQIHLDAATAQRSMFGSQIVHGIHNLIACLDELAADSQVNRFVAALRESSQGFDVSVKFANPIFLDESTQIKIIRFDERSLKVGAFIDQLKVTEFTISAAKCGDRVQWVDPVDAEVKFPLGDNQMPLDFDKSDIPDLKGILDCSTLKTELIAQRYPNASSLFGERFIRYLAPLSALVGMYAPGRFSIFSTLNLSSIPQKPIRSQNKDIRFAIDRYDERFGLLKTVVSCSQYFGSIEAFQRPRPVDPPNYSHIAKRFTSNRFQNSTSLVVGGSRGLGALLTKALIAEGGKVFSSFARSKLEMDKMISEVKSPKLSAFNFDVLDVEHGILEALERATPDYIFYMATPHIFARRTKKWDQSLFEKFNKFYVGGLSEVASSADKLGRCVKIYNPSSVVIDEPIDALLEYRISKVASEQMALSFSKSSKTVEIINDRLPRLMTDQNSQVMSGQGSDMFSVVDGIFDRIRSG